MFGEGSFFDKYFNVNLSDYPAFGFNFNVSLLVFGLFIGICAAIILISHLKSTSALVLRQLLRHEAKSEDSAKTLADLGLADNKSAKRALVSDKTLRRLVTLVGESRPSYEEYTAMTKEEQASFDRRGDIDFDSALFYIAEDNRERATRAVHSDTSSPFNAALLCVLMLGAYFMLSLALPSLLSFAASLLG